MSGHKVVTVSVTLAFDGILGSVAALGAGSDERPGKGQFHFSGDLSFTRMERLGEVGEFGLNHIPAKNAACESGPEGSNPSLSAITTERSALGGAIT
jgi:hypothetical protein